MLLDILLMIEYTQVLVYNKNHPSPGLIWTNEHVQQGFAWSEGLVSFGVPDHDDECRLQVILSDDTELSHVDVIWAVQVPYVVTEPLQIGTVFDTQEVNIPAGNYNLIFEALKADEEYSYILRLRFVKTKDTAFVILKQGGDITTPHVLKQNAAIAD